jgi:hypothetical protein
MSLADRCDQIVRLIDDALRDLPATDGAQRPSFDPDALCAVPHDGDRRKRPPDADPDGPAVRHVAA